MSFSVHCDACQARFNMPEHLWNKRVAGRVITIHCRKCGAPIELDGRQARQRQDRAQGSGSKVCGAHERTEIAKPLGVVSARSAARPREPAVGAGKAARTLAARGSSAADGVAIRQPGAPDRLEKAARVLKASSTRGASQSAHGPKPAGRTLEGVQVKAASPAAAASQPAIEPRSRPGGLARDERNTLARDGHRGSALRVDERASQQRRAPAASAKPPRALADSSKAGPTLRQPSSAGQPALETPRPELAAMTPETASFQPFSSDERGPLMAADSVPTLRAVEVNQYLDGEQPRPRPANEPPVAVEPVRAPMTQAELVGNTATVRQTRSRVAKLSWLAVPAALAAAIFASSHTSQPPPSPMAVGLGDPVLALEPALDTSELARPSAERAQTADEPKVLPVDAASSQLPAYSEYHQRRMEFIVGATRRRAERCHWQGRAVGTVSLTMTFAPDGRVSEFQLEGEPVASAPVAVCIESLYRAMLIPAFEGAPFTLTEQLTLR